MVLIYGHCFDFAAEPALNHCYHTSDRIRVVPAELPAFAYRTPYHPHSLREVSYQSHEPFEKTKGYHVTWAMEVKDVLKLAWFPEAREIRYEKSAHFTPERLRFWVYHTFLPLLFEMERLYHILHVGAVAIEGKAVLFMAPSFGGKSTLTDHFLKAGYALLSDDTLAVKKKGEVFRAVASWPFHRPYRDPEVLGHKTENFVVKPLPIGGIFLLEKSDAHAQIMVEPIKGVEKYKALHMASFIPLAFLKERTFIFKSELAREVAMFRVTVPWDKERLSEVEHAIVSTVTAK